MTSVENVKEIIKALCTELQLGYTEPRSVQECIELSNGVMLNATNLFANDIIVRSSIGVATGKGFRMALNYNPEPDAEEEEGDGTEEPEPEGEEEYP
jgi:hypothetical protein